MAALRWVSAFLCILSSEIVLAKLFLGECNWDDFCEYKCRRVGLEFMECYCQPGFMRTPDGRKCKAAPPGYVDLSALESSGSGDYVTENCDNEDGDCDGKRGIQTHIISGDGSSDEEDNEETDVLPAVFETMHSVSTQFTTNSTITLLEPSASLTSSPFTLQMTASHTPTTINSYIKFKGASTPIPDMTTTNSSPANQETSNIRPSYSSTLSAEYTGTMISSSANVLFSTSVPEISQSTDEYVIKLASSSILYDPVSTITSLSSSINIERNSALLEQSVSSSKNLHFSNTSVAEDIEVAPSTRFSVSETSQPILPLVAVSSKTDEHISNVEETTKLAVKSTVVPLLSSSTDHSAVIFVKGLRNIIKSSYISRSSSVYSNLSLHSNSPQNRRRIITKHESNDSIYSNVAGAMTEPIDATSINAVYHSKHILTTVNPVQSLVKPNRNSSALYEDGEKSQLSVSTESRDRHPSDLPSTSYYKTEKPFTESGWMATGHPRGIFRDSSKSTEHIITTSYELEGEKGTSVTEPTVESNDHDDESNNEGNDLDFCLRHNCACNKCVVDSGEVRCMCTAENHSSGQKLNWSSIVALLTCVSLLVVNIL